ncbi:hypothetical protein KGM_210400B, partial [Danaus plexippus plexippus]
PVPSVRDENLYNQATTKELEKMLERSDWARNVRKCYKYRVQFKHK